MLERITNTQRWDLYQKSEDFPYWGMLGKRNACLKEWGDDFWASPGDRLFSRRFFLLLNPRSITERLITTAHLMATEERIPGPLPRVSDTRSKIKIDSASRAKALLPFQFIWTSSETLAEKCINATYCGFSLYFYQYSGAKFITRLSYDSLMNLHHE